MFYADWCIYSKKAIPNWAAKVGKIFTLLFFDTDGLMYKYTKEKSVE